MLQHRKGERIRLTLILSHTLYIPCKKRMEELERIGWFRGKLHEFKILNSDELRRQFHARVLGFFVPRCESQIFMAWESSVGSFGARELLSIESLFKVHPEACLVILSRTLDSIHGYRILKPILDGGGGVLEFRQ